MRHHCRSHGLWLSPMHQRPEWEAVIPQRLRPSTIRNVSGTAVRDRDPPMRDYFPKCWKGFQKNPGRNANSVVRVPSQQSPGTLRRQAAKGPCHEDCCGRKGLIAAPPGLCDYIEGAEMVWVRTDGRRISDHLALLEQGNAEIAACDTNLDDRDGTWVHGSKGVRLGPKGSGTGVLAACASGAAQSVTPSR